MITVAFTLFQYSRLILLYCCSDVTLTYRKLVASYCEYYSNVRVQVVVGASTNKGEEGVLNNNDENHEVKRVGALYKKNSEIDLFTVT